MQDFTSEKDLLRLHDFMELNLILRNVRKDKPLINAFGNSIDAMTEDIIKDKTISFVIDKLELSKEYFKTSVVKKILEHNFALISSGSHASDCPVVKEIINIYFEIGLMVQDIFLICNAIVKSVVLHLKQENSAILTTDLEQLFTYNIYNVFTMYSDMIEQQKYIIEEKNSIISDNVLFSKTDLEGVIIEVTDAYCDFTGYTRDELIGNTHNILIDPEMDKAVYKDLWETITSGKEWFGELKNIRKDGSKFTTTLKIVPVKEKGNTVAYAAFRHDITSNKLAFIDPLTSLLNRRAFEVQFDKLWKHKTNLNLNMAILDIDDFKLVNDTYGHSFGDEVLVKISQLLYECTRSTDICARWGGEEFVVLLPRLSLEDAQEVMQRIVNSVAKENFIPNKTITVSAGLGKRKYHEDKISFFNRVDARLYKAKENGKNQVCMD